MHPDRTLVATGESGKRPKIFIWDSETAEVFSKVKLGRVRAVKSIAWSCSGKYLAATAMDNEHTVYLINPK